MVSEIQTEPALLRQWKKSDTGINSFELARSLLSYDWQSPRSLYSQYCEKKQDPVHKQTFSKYLRELEALGEAQSKGAGSARRYRKADIPVSSVVNGDYNNQALDSMTKKLREIAKQEVRRSLEEGALEDLIERKAVEKMSHVLEKIDLEISNRDQDRLQSKVALELMKEDTKTCSNHETEILGALDSLEGWVSSTAIYEIYSECVQDPMTRRTVRRRLAELDDAGLILKKGSTRNTKYRSKLS